MGHRDRRHALHGRRVPLGLLGEPGASRPRVALRRPAPLAARADRPSRGGDRGGAGAFRRRPLPAVECELPRPLRHAVRARAQGAGSRDRPRVPRHRRSASASSPAASGVSSGRCSSRTSRRSSSSTTTSASAKRLQGRPGIDADAIVARLDDAEVSEAYERDREEARRAAGTAAELQGKTSTSDGPVRFTAPSLVFEKDGLRLVAGGWQPVLSYDTLLANLDPTLERTPPPETPMPLLDHFPAGLTTAEVAALLADGADPVSGSRKRRASAARARRRGLRDARAAGAGCGLAFRGRRARPPSHRRDLGRRRLGLRWSPKLRARRALRAWSGCSTSAAGRSGKCASRVARSGIAIGFPRDPMLHVSWWALAAVLVIVKLLRRR